MESFSTNGKINKKFIGRRYSPSLSFYYGTDIQIDKKKEQRKNEKSTLKNVLSGWLTLRAYYYLLEKHLRSTHKLIPIKILTTIWK